MSEETDIGIVKEIAQRYGTVIDLEKAPMVLVEILRNYGGRFSAQGPNLSVSVQGGQGSSVGSVGGVGSTSGGTTTGSGRPEVGLEDVMRGILHLQRAVSLIDNQVKELLARDSVGARPTHGQ